jgi:hypothetical protein
LVFAARATRDEAWVARAIDRYNELCARPALGGPRAVSNFVAAQTQSGLTFGGRVLCRSLRPALISPDSLAELRDAAKLFWDAIGVIERKALSDSSVALELGLSQQEQELIAIDPGYDDATVVSRIDTFFCATPAIIEYNADSPAGIFYQSKQIELMRQLPVFERFAQDHRLECMTADLTLRDTLMAVWREFVSRKRLSYRPPVVAILDLSGVPTTAEFALIQQSFDSHGIASLVLTPEELHYENGKLTAGGRPIDLVYKRLLVADFLARYDLSHPFIQAYAAGDVCVASSFRCTISQKKRSLAMLHDERYANWFEPVQLAAVRKLIAPTWNYKDFDRLVLERDRHNFVLKPSDAYGGKNVFLGWECSAQEWQDALRTADQGDFVVQHRVMTPRGTYPVFEPDMPNAGARLAELIEDRNAYVFRGLLGGVLTRLSPTGLINVSRGGQAIPTFIIFPERSA